MASGQQMRGLYRAFLREAAKFPNYNIREYIRRKVREDFRTPAVGDHLQQQALDQLAVVKRQATIYSLYARSVPNVMELKPE